MASPDSLRQLSTLTARMGPSSATRRSKRLRTATGTVPPDGIDGESETRTRGRLKSVNVTVGGGPMPRPLPRPEASLSTTLSSPSFRVEEWKILPREFFQIDALDLAPRLLGKFLRRDGVVLQITEVEAYRPNDSASHGRFGITARTAPAFGPGGHAYVYLCYGMHTMLNVVADKEGVGAGVLIRACSPVAGLETIQHRRGQKTEKPILLTGPGKVSQALGISTHWSNHPLYMPGGLELRDGPRPENILIGPRVGIEFALPEDVNALWRFAIAGSPWVSAPRNSLRQP